MAGSAGQKRVQTDYLKTYRVPLPSLAEQRRVVEVIHESDAGIAAISAKLAVLQAQKRGLMQRLLTGEVRVRAGGRAVARP